MNDAMREALTTIAWEQARYEGNELHLPEGGANVRARLLDLLDALERAEAEATARWQAKADKVKAMEATK